MATQTTIKKLPLIKEDVGSLKMRIQDVRIFLYVFFLYLLKYRKKLKQSSLKKRFRIIKID